MSLLTDSQLERYARHIVLREVGGAGQRKLLSARVLVLGAGGLGAPALLYLAAAGVGHIGIVDDDDVALSNLQRQVIHRSQDVGRAKTDSAADAIAALNPDVEVARHHCRLTADNGAALLGDYDLLIDGTDNFAARFAANDACLALRRPLVSAAVGPFDGQLAVFKGYRPDLPCYRCLVPEAPPLASGTCADEGILGALTGVMGSMAALEAIKEILGFGDSLAGRLLIYDALGARIRTIALKKDPACPACGAAR
ncbi:MAG: molybdopterin-synthase adenylyltransferase MoeB [Sphingomonadales bacterium]